MKKYFILLLIAINLGLGVQGFSAMTKSEKEKLENQINKAYEKKDTKTEKSLIVKYLNEFPDDAGYLNMLGTLYDDEENYKEAQNIVNKAIEKYPKDALIPKFELLNAFIIGRSESKEKMISSLQQIVLNYERTNEGKKAKEILDFLVPSKKKEADETKNKDTENKEQNPEPETTENETDIISIN